MILNTAYRELFVVNNLNAFPSQTVTLCFPSQIYLLIMIGNGRDGVGYRKRDIYVFLCPWPRRIFKMITTSGRRGRGESTQNVRLFMNIQLHNSN